MNEFIPTPEQEAPLVTEIRMLWRAAKERLGTRKFVEAYIDFSNRLKEKYPDYDRRRAYHALIMSTMPDRTDVIEEDFPGEDSVVEFLQSLAIP